MSNYNSKEFLAALDIYQNIVDKAEIDYPEFDQNDWYFCINKRKSSLGICNYTRRSIEISELLLKSGNTKRIRDTIIHEVAHAIAGHKAHHNKAWKEICIHLGGDGKTTCNWQPEDDRHKWQVIVDGTNEVIWKYYRKPRKNFSRSYVSGRKEETFGKLVLQQIR